ncbi:MAG: hypothetical protein MUF48_05540 [Pirellulaceae bacterium]|jgi:cytochrome c553|nr:hypothetical protein [Pirellulaceae bacterium]
MEQHLKECLARRAAAAGRLQERAPTLPAEQVTHSLVYGLNTLRNLLFQRIHDDVESHLGRDSMLLPVRADESERLAKCEIESYQVAAAARAIHERHYVDTDMKWLAGWLAELRLGADVEDPKWRRRVRQYVALPEDDQRLEFSRNLEGVFPEARRAPLILYRLVPLSVRIVCAVAFGHHLEAAEWRNRQTLWLPAIGDCHECHGRALDNGDQCPVCGNPVWTYHWLCAD